MRKARFLMHGGAIPRTIPREAVLHMNCDLECLYSRSQTDQTDFQHEQVMQLMLYHTKILNHKTKSNGLHSRVICQEIWPCFNTSLTINNCLNGLIEVQINSFTIQHLLLRNICENPDAWLASNTWDLINSPVFLNRDLIRGRESGGHKWRDCFLKPLCRAVSVSVTAHSCRQAVPGSTPAAQMPEQEPHWSPFPLASFPPFAEQMMEGEGCVPPLTATQRDGVWATLQVSSSDSHSPVWMLSWESGVFTP